MIQPFAPGGAVRALCANHYCKGRQIHRPAIRDRKPAWRRRQYCRELARRLRPTATQSCRTRAGKRSVRRFIAICRLMPITISVPVTLVTTSPIFLVASGKSQFKSIGDFVAAAKAKPGSLSYGSAGVGTSLHFAMELLKSKAGIDVVHVPYRGVAPNTTAMIAGDVAVSIMPYAAVKPHIGSGGLRILGVTAAKRTSLLPDVPTIAESGFPDYELVSWQGWFVPAKTPREIVNLLQREAAKALASKDVQDRLRIRAAKPSAAPRNISRRITSRSWPCTNVWPRRPRLPRKIEASGLLTDLILRSGRRPRLPRRKAAGTARRHPPILRDAALREAPQDEARSRSVGIAHMRHCTVTFFSLMTRPHSCGFLGEELRGVGRRAEHRLERELLQPLADLRALAGSRPRPG